MRYECENCGNHFAEPLIVLEGHGLGGPWREELECCPRCRMSGIIGDWYDAGGTY